MIRLGVNVDHVATLRQVRKARVPDLVEAALEAIKGGADSITVHLREDRRHIQDDDVRRLTKILPRPLNLEMSLVPEIVEIALNLVPEKVCLVPERRQELTTEGGLDLLEKKKLLQRVVPKLRARGIEVSLCVDPEIEQLRVAKAVGADAVELHTGSYANAGRRGRGRELERLRRAAIAGHRLGLKVNVGHGLDYENISAVEKLPYIHEANIGHSIVARSVFVGMRQAVREMKRKLKDA